MEADPGSSQLLKTELVQLSRIIASWKTILIKSCLISLQATFLSLISRIHNAFQPKKLLNTVDKLMEEVYAKSESFQQAFVILIKSRSYFHMCPLEIRTMISSHFISCIA
jgi:hypothetical protein